MAILDISALESNFDGDVVPKGHPDYAAAIARWAANAAREARWVVFPKGPGSVSAAVKWAVANSIPIAVRGGGHAASGASSVEDGLVIDLSRHLRSVRVDAENKLVYIGGGALWADVDKTVIEHGLATVGGTVNHTGVGGLTLGGGYGYLSGEHGLVVDNLVEVTIVVADGRILKASETENQDLFWGIRGGGGNFGCVTEFVLKLHEQRKTVFAGLLVFPGPMIPVVFETIKKLWDDKFSPKQALLALIGCGPPTFQPMVLMTPFFNGSEEEGRRLFKPLFDLGPVVDTCGELPFEQLNAIHNVMLGHGKNVYMAGSSFMSDSTQTPLAMYDKIVELEKNSPDPTDVHFAAAFEYFPLEAINNVSSTATAFPSRGYQSGMGFMAMWVNPTDAKFAAAKDGITELKQTAIRCQDYNNEKVVNDGYSNMEGGPEQSTLKSRLLFKHNYPKLQLLKGQYDPTGVFSRWFPIEPIALSSESVQVRLI